MANKLIYTTEEERELLRRLAKSDQFAFAQIVKRYNPIIYPYLIFWLKEIQLAEEVAQDVFMRIWKSKEKLAEIDNFSGYIYIIARNQAKTALAKRLSQRVEQGAEISDGLVINVQPSIETKELAAAINAAIGQLPPKRREVFLLSRNEGLSYDEIAGRLQIARSTVNDHMVAALVFLRHRIREQTGIIIPFVLVFSAVQ